MVRLGQRLYHQRLRRKLTLDEIARATKIKASFLAAIERGEYHKLPSPAYAKGFVTNYAAYLGFSKAETVALFKREFDEKRAYKVLPDSLTKNRGIPQRMIKIQESLLLIGGLIILFAGFLFFQYRSAFFAPSLRVSSPKENAVVTQDVTVTGKTNSEAAVTVNNEQVSLESNGTFHKHVTLFPGKNMITIKAKNRFGKETIVTRAIEVK